MSDRRPHQEPLPGSPPDGEIGETYGHFRIIERLGQGGMGVVYKATDTRLGRVVALKFLPPALSNDTEARSRFSVEARAASALDHPNICTVHEIAESGAGRVYIAMSYYDGETLQEKIARGVLPLVEAIDYAAQIARGLAKAHAAGIVHRDIKPANVIVTKDGIAKILDFGVAKLEDNDVTRTGHMLGTVAHMSPEQASGEHVDHRTDLWAVGILLYQMLGARHPFGERAAGAMLYAILHEDPPPLGQTNPRVPADIERIVHGCLVRDPDRRYQNAEELLADFDRTGYASSSGPVSVTRGPQERRRASAPLRFLARAGVPLALLLAIAVAIPPVRHAVFGGVSELQADVTSVAVLPLTTVNPLPGDEALADGLTYSLASMLVSLEGERDALRVVPASEIVNRSVTTALEASQLFEVSVVLRGSLRRTPTGERIVELELIQLDPIDLLDSATLPDPGAEEFPQAVRLALARLFDLGDTEVTRLAHEEPTVAGAYAYYLQGLGYLHRRDLANSMDSAIQLFERALAEDSTYALAYAGLCEARFQKYRQTADTTLSRQALENCDDAAGLAQDQPQVLTALGSVLLQTGEPDRARRRLEEALRLAPDDANIHRWLGRYYEDQGLPAESEQAYLEAVGLRPDSWIYQSELATLLAYNNRVEEARERYREASLLTPDNYLMYNGVGFTSLMLGEIEEARRNFAESIRRRPNPIAYRNLGYLNMREQRWEEAIRELETGLAIGPDWWSWRRLGNARHWIGDETGAREAWQQVIDILTPQLSVNPGETDYLLGLAEAQTLIGNRAEGRRLLDRALLRVRETSWNYFPYYIGRLFEILGSREQAIPHIADALERGFDPVMVDNDPWLEDLRLDPRFLDARERTSAR